MFSIDFTSFFFKEDITKDNAKDKIEVSINIIVSKSNTYSLNTYWIVILPINAATHRAKLMDLKVISCLSIMESTISNIVGIAKNNTPYQIELVLNLYMLDIEYITKTIIRLTLLTARILFPLSFNVSKKSFPFLRIKEIHWYFG